MSAQAQAGRCAMGLSPDCFVIARPSRVAIDYLEYAHARGAGGIQCSLNLSDPESWKKLRARAEEFGMYLEACSPRPMTRRSSRPR
jgi:hypothetical protein